MSFPVKAQQPRSSSADITFLPEISDMSDIRSIRATHNSGPIIGKLDHQEINTAPNRRKTTSIRTGRSKTPSSKTRER